MAPTMPREFSDLIVACFRSPLVVIVAAFCFLAFSATASYRAARSGIDLVRCWR
jgi:hypothetical protein